jgi:hypothetical protein
LVVKGKVVTWNDVDSGILLNFPMLKTKSLSLSQEVFARKLPAPVGFSGLLEVPKDSLAGET